MILVILPNLFVHLLLASSSIGGRYGKSVGFVENFTENFTEKISQKVS